MKSGKPYRRSLIVALLILLGLLTTAGETLAQCSDIPGIVPPNAKYRGLTYPEWQVRWWRWALSMPVTNPVTGELHPWFGDNVLQGQSGKVWFLNAPYMTSEVVPERTITIPAGTALFFPVPANFECSTAEPPPWHGDTEAEVRALVKRAVDAMFDVSAEIDGVPVTNLAAYRHQSPFFELTLIPDNVLFVPGGTTGHGVDDGYYLLLEPLSVGQHTIRTFGRFDLSSFGITDILTYGVIYHITVAPHPLSGIITLLESVNSSQPLTFTFRDPKTHQELFTRTLVLTEGSYGFDDIPDGGYLMAVKGSKWLRRTLPIKIQAGTPLEVNLTLIPGDANNDNQVDIFDLATLAEDFNTLAGDANWNGGRSDFNCDDSVDIFDLATLATYFNTTGDE